MIYCFFIEICQWVSKERFWSANGYKTYWYIELFAEILENKMMHLCVTRAIYSYFWLYSLLFIEYFYPLYLVYLISIAFSIWLFNSFNIDMLDWFIWIGNVYAVGVIILIYIINVRCIRIKLYCFFRNLSMKAFVIADYEVSQHDNLRNNKYGPNHLLWHFLWISKEGLDDKSTE